MRTPSPTCLPWATISSCLSLFIPLGCCEQSHSKAEYTFEDSPTSATLNGVIVRGEDLAATAVGEHGTIISRDEGLQGVWQSVESGSTADLFAITAAVHSADHVVVGAQGTILRGFGQGGWTQVDSGTNADLRTASFLGSSTHVIAAGDGVVLISKDGGASWSPSSIPDASMNFRALGTIQVSEGNSPRWEVLAVGDEGRGILSLDSGNSWTTLEFDTNATLAAVASGTRFIVYAEDGTIWTRDSGESPEFRGDGKEPPGVRAGSPDHGWLVSSDGTMTATAHNVRGPQNTAGPHESWLAIDGDYQDAIAVGEGGAIMRVEVGFTEGCRAL